jgi:hypothetical protein
LSKHEYDIQRLAAGGGCQPLSTDIVSAAFGGIANIIHVRPPTDGDGKLSRATLLFRNREEGALVTESSPARYMFEQNLVDRERLRLASGLLDQLTSETCVRAGTRPGAHAIDIGCGQLGALATLADLGGQGGVVVGLDSSADALAGARDSLASIGLNAVHLVEADINTLDPAALEGCAPFDLAVCRLLLTRQRDPVATLLGRPSTASWRSDHCHGSVARPGVPAL